VDNREAQFSAGGVRMVRNMCSWVGMRRIGVAIAAFMVSVLGETACSSGSDDRAVVATSDPPVACPRIEGPRASKDAGTAIARAKGAWSSMYEKNPYNDMFNPSNAMNLEPYTATLKEGVWHIEGTVRPGFHGYFPVISLCKNDEGMSVAWHRVP
jgi:hypothetical protein